MLEKFKFFKDKDKSKAASKSKTAAAAAAARKDATGARSDDVTGELPDGAASASLRGKKSKSKSRDGLAGMKVDDGRVNGGAVTPSPSTARGVTPGGNAPSVSGSRRGFAALPGNRSDSSLKDAQHHSASNSASKIGAIAQQQERSSLPKAKGSASATNFSSIPAPGSSLPKPASSKQARDKGKLRSSASRDGLTQGQPARRSASMSAATGHAVRGALPPGQRAPSGMPQSRPPTAHISFLAQVRVISHIRDDKQHYSCEWKYIDTLLCQIVDLAFQYS